MDALSDQGAMEIVHSHMETTEFLNSMALTAQYH
jgi:hypothetical protein